MSILSDRLVKARGVVRNLAAHRRVPTITSKVLHWSNFFCFNCIDDFGCFDRRCHIVHADDVGAFEN